MKLFAFIFLMLLCCKRDVAAQNHVPNGDFELYSNCPNSPSQINYTNGWNTFTTGSPDYYHMCGSNGLNVPNMSNGYQYPASGSAFTGVLTYVEHYNVKEYITCAINSLQSGCTYEVSMSVSLAEKTRWATDDFGVLFYKNGPSFVNNGLPLPLTPQVNYYNYGIITDTSKWTRLSSIYTPDSAYNHIVIGGFKDSSVVGKKNLQNGFSPAAYYYIDSVVVRPLKVSLLFPDTFLCQNQIINVPYTVLPCANYNLGNVFRLQLSDANGDFTNPINIGSVTSTISGNIQGTIPHNTPTGFGYRLRIISTSSVDSSLDNGFNIVIGTPVKAISNTPVCEGNALDINAVDVLFGTTFSWVGPSFSSMQQYNTLPSAIPSHSGKYIVTATYKNCDAKDSMIVNVKPLPIVLPSNNSPVCPGETIQLNAGSSYPSATYSWNGPGFSSSDKNPSITSVAKTNEGAYTVSATVDGCTSVPASTQVTIKDVPAPPQAVDTTVCRYANVVKVSVKGDSIKWYYTKNATGSYTQPEISTSDTIPVILFTTQTVNGCESEKVHLTIRKKDLPVFELGDNKTLCQGDSIILGKPVEDVTYNWNTGASVCCITVKDEGIYTQSVTNSCGTKTDDISVIITPCKKCVYVASAFSPNNDGLNDMFGASSICAIKEFKMRIYNRWSDLVFQSDNILNKWDGQYKGKLARMDTYYYYIEYLADIPNGISKRIFLKGDVTLIR